MDSLPAGPKWYCDIVQVDGDLRDAEGNPVVEELELWRRDPLDCVRELIQNPAFQANMRFAPEMVFRDSEGKERVIDEAWTADWWWEMQIRWRLHRAGTFC